MEKFGFSYPAGRNVKWCNHLESSVAVPQKGKQLPFAPNSTGRCMRSENTCPLELQCGDWI